jgi:hypothetical protein
MKIIKTISVALGFAIAAISLGCAPLSSPPTERERTAAVGGLAGGAGGAIIGSMAGGAVAGGLFGIPIGAVAGWYIGDYMAREDRLAQTRLDERDAELNRLRRENDRLRREDDDRPARGAQLSSREQGQGVKSSAQETIKSEQDITSSQQQTSRREPTNSQQSVAKSQPSQQDLTSSQPGTVNAAQVRQAQKKLNDMGYRAGQVDGVWGPNTQAAIRNFQQAKGLEATGRLNPQTINALGIEDSGQTGVQTGREPRKSNQQK